MRKMFSRLWQAVSGRSKGNSRSNIETSGSTGQIPLRSAPKEETFSPYVQAFVDHDYESCFALHETLLQAEQIYCSDEQIFAITLQRLGRAKLLKNITPSLLTGTSDTPWQLTLMRFTLDSVEWEEVLEEAKDDEQRCLAFYYAGAKMLTQGRVEEARTMYERSLATDCNLWERRLARAELNFIVTHSADRLSQTPIEKRFSQCCVAFINRDYGECLGLAFMMIADGDEAMPALVQVITQLVTICSQRMGGREITQVFGAGGIALTLKDPWQHSLLKLTLGQADPSDVRTKAKNDHQRCQADYYVGCRLLTMGNEDGARRAFELCVQGPVDCWERLMARQELEPIPNISIPFLAPLLKTAQDKETPSGPRLKPSEPTFGTVRERLESIFATHEGNGKMMIKSAYYTDDSHVPGEVPYNVGYDVLAAMRMAREAVATLANLESQADDLAQIFEAVGRAKAEYVDSEDDRDGYGAGTFTAILNHLKTIKDEIN